MAERLSRKELYDLVWSEPMRSVSARFGISDVALKKTCAKAVVPTPERGYWAKKESGKNMFVPTLPDRAPGMDDEVLVAGRQDHWYRDWNKEELLGPLPPPPEFKVPIESVREQIALVIGQVRVPREFKVWHPVVERLLKEDEKRREKQVADPYPVSWENPLFDTPFERRRLRILNSLFVAIGKFNGKPSPYGREAQVFHIGFYSQYVRLSLAPPQVQARRSTAGSKVSKETLALSLHHSNSEETRITWQDSDDTKVEAHLTEAAVEIVLTAEVHYRESAARQHRWRVERKAELEEEERQRLLEAERAEMERVKRLGQARIDGLLNDATAFQQAGQIRMYVKSITLSQSSLGTTPTEDLDRWSQWALAQADRIDPAIGEKFLAAIREE